MGKLEDILREEKEESRKEGIYSANFRMAKLLCEQYVSDTVKPDYDDFCIKHRNCFGEIGFLEGVQEFFKR